MNIRNISESMPSKKGFPTRLDLRIIIIMDSVGGWPIARTAGLQQAASPKAHLWSQRFSESSVRLSQVI